MCALVVAGMVLPGSAFAEGGQSIAGATPVIYGQQQFGSTLNGGLSGGGCSSVTVVYRSWWSLPVIAGDTVTIDWETDAAPVMVVYPVGTTDFTFLQALAVNDPGQVTNANHKAELVIKAQQSGSMPLEFTANTACAPPPSPNAGPYDFTARVAHGLRLALPNASSVGHRSVVRVSAHAPDGGTITNPALKVDVQINTGKSWRTVGTASVANSAAAVHVSIPSSLEHRRVRLRALAHGPSYRTVPSAARRVLVR